MSASRIAISGVAVILAVLACARTTAAINYFDCQPPPSDIPVVFAPGIVSREDTWEEKIAFLPDGSEAFFGRHPDGGENYFHPKVMQCKFVDGRWSPPEVARFSKGKRLGWPLLSAAGPRLFMEECEGKIVFTDRVNGQWSPTEYLQPKVEASKGFGLGQITNDETLYFHDRWGRIAYSSKRVGGSYLQPKPLSRMINPCVEFFVSPQDDYIIFQPLNWQNQLHICFRDEQGDWDMPIPFGTYFTGNKWNCKGNGPSISPDGKYLFFGKAGDIYWIKADFIEALRRHVRKY